MRPSSRGAFLLAVGSYFIITTFVPFGRTILFPLALFATWVHEMGHGLMALLVGGHFDHLAIYSGGSGLAFTTAPATAEGSMPWQQGLISMAGLLAPPFVGAVLLGVSRGPRRARLVLGTLLTMMVVSLVVWVRSITGWVAIPLVVLAVAYFAFRASPRTRMVFAQFVGVVLAMDALNRRDYLFSDAAVIESVSRPSDIATVAASFGGRYLVWGAVVALLAVVLLLMGLFLAWKDEPNLPRARA